MWSFKNEPLKYSCYFSPSSVNNLVLSQEQFVFMCCEVFNPTEGNGKECEQSQASCRGHRWNLKSRSQLGAPEAGKLSRELENQLNFQGVRQWEGKSLCRKTKKTWIRFHHRNVEGDVCPKKDAEEIIKLKISMAQWLCLWLLRKFRNGKSAAEEVCFLAVEILKPSKSMCWRVSENCRAESIYKPQDVG